jgi:hypothetical protein
LGGTPNASLGGTPSPALGGSPSPALGGSPNASLGGFLKRQRHNGVRILDPERKALDDGEDVVAPRVHLSELWRSFGGDREIDGITGQR